MISLPRDVLVSVIDRFEDPCDLIAFGLVDKYYLKAANYLFAQRISNIFGQVARNFLGISDENPYRSFFIAVKLWAPIKPRVQEKVPGSSLLAAIHNGNLNQLKNLLYRGASLSAQLYFELNGVTFEPAVFNYIFDMNKGLSIECVALIMRSWKYENGIDAIQTDKNLAAIAGRLLRRNPPAAQVLISYGVVPLTLKRQKIS